jgi:poly(A) polymerase
MAKIYKVGGCVRDEFLGLNSKDIDFTFVLDDLNMSVDEGFKIMEQWMTERNYTIFLSTPEMFTIRAKFPKGHENEGLVADFVLARKEIGYHPGTRRPILELGTIEDDLIRRDFTVNAMAIDEDGNLIDLFNGVEDLKNMVLKTPLPTEVTFNDDPLRILRAIRFSITKGFAIPASMAIKIEMYDYETKMDVVSLERIREELLKCFKHNTLDTLDGLNYFSSLRNYIFKQNILWLKPTFEQ